MEGTNIWLTQTLLLKIEIKSFFEEQLKDFLINFENCFIIIKGSLVSKSLQGVVTCFTGTTSTGSLTEIACSSSVTFGGGTTYNYCAVRFKRKFT